MRKMDKLGWVIPIDTTPNKTDKILRTLEKIYCKKFPHGVPKKETVKYLVKKLNLLIKGC